MVLHGPGSRSNRPPILGDCHSLRCRLRTKQRRRSANFDDSSAVAIRRLLSFRLGFSTMVRAFQKSLIQPSHSDTEYSLKLQREWIPRIMNRYSNSPTAIVLTPVPRGPFLGLLGFYRGYDSVLPSSVIQRGTFSLPGHSFDFLEKPEYYFDAFHLNSKGRRRFTETLVSELMGHVRAANLQRQYKFESQVALN